MVHFLKKIICKNDKLHSILYIEDKFSFADQAFHKLNMKHAHSINSEFDIIYVHIL